MAQDKGSQTIRVYFRCMGYGFLVLCIKSAVIGGSTLLVVRHLWYTFIYMFIVSIWFGLTGMAIADFYLFLKRLVKKNYKKRYKKRML